MSGKSLLYPTITSAMLALFLSPPLVRGQAAEGFSTDQPVLQPESVATADSGHAFYFNPAGPAFTQPRALEYFQTGVPADDHPGMGDVGRALIWSLPNSRLGWQQFSTETGQAIGMVSYSQSWHPKARLGLGLGVNYHYFRNELEPRNNQLSLQAGSLFRPTRGLSLGLAVDHALSPWASDPAFESRLRFGVGIRPIGERLTLSADLSSSIRALFEDPAPRWLFAAAYEPILGIRLRGNFQIDTASTTEDPLYYAGMGLELRFKGLGISDAMLTRRTEGGSSTLANTLGVGTYGQSARTLFEPGSVLGQVWEVRLEGSLEPPPAQGLLAGNPSTFPLLHQVQRLREALENKRVRGVLLVIDSPAGGLAEMQELRSLILKLKAQDKKVIAYLFRPKAAELYLASACSYVVMHPAGELELEAPRRETYYLQGLLEELGIQAQYVRRSAYKSAPEQYIATAPSAETLEMNRWLLDDLFLQLKTGIAEGRQLAITDVEAAFRQQTMTGPEGLQQKLIDELRYPDELEQVAEKLLGHSHTLVKEEDYRPRELTRWGPQYRIALVYMGGAINRGGGGITDNLRNQESTNSLLVVKALDELQEDRDVKAVVLRLDSPGGDAFASDELWRAVQRLRATRPVIVSMGGMAASGAYYTAVAGDVLLANPATLTGSIGVYTGKFSGQKLLEKYKVNPITFSAQAGALELDSVSRPWSEEERKRVEASVDNTYRLFRLKVADGRRMTMEQVEQVAGGRVWTGRQALEKHLVDQLGGLDDAIQLARERSGIARGQLVRLEVWPQRSITDSVMSTLGPDVSLESFTRLLLQAAVANLHAELESLSSPSLKAER